MASFGNPEYQSPGSGAARSTAMVAIVLVAVVFVAGCSPREQQPAGATVTSVDKGKGIVETSAEMPAQLDPGRPIRATWGAAAVAEAERLSPLLVGASAQRIHLSGIGDRIKVTAAGYCHIFGGRYDATTGWQANDLGEC